MRSWLPSRARAQKKCATTCATVPSWLLRLGDGTAQSHARMQAALDYLMPYHPRVVDALRCRKSSYCTQAWGPTCGALQAQWQASVSAVITEATLKYPAARGYIYARQRRPTLRTPELPAGRDAKPSTRAPEGHLVMGARTRAHLATARTSTRPGNPGRQHP